MFGAVVLAPVVDADDGGDVDDTCAVVSSVDADCVDDSANVAGGVDVCNVDVVEDTTGCVVGPHSLQ